MLESVRAKRKRYRQKKKKEKWEVKLEQNLRQRWRERCDDMTDSKKELQRPTTQVPQEEVPDKMHTIYMEACNQHQGKIDEPENEAYKQVAANSTT